MTLSLAPTVVILLGTFAGALVSAFSGFAFAPVAGIILITAFQAKAIVPLLMICSIIVQVTTLLYLRRSLAFGSIGSMLVGGALGVPLAVLLFQRLDPHLFQVAFGLFLAAYSTVMLMRPCSQTTVVSRRSHEVAVGFLGGLVGGLTAMPGAVPTIYCDCRGASKVVQRATVQPFILAMQVLALTLMVLHGDIDAGIGDLVVTALPGLVVGVAAGLLLYGRVPDAGFRRAVLFLLLTTGLGLAARPQATTPPDRASEPTTATRYSDRR